jgi:predicted ATPase
LRGEGEWLHRLASLEVPPESTDLTSEDALKYSAVELFSERASAIAEGFSFGAVDLPAVIEICRKLDGVPLALELAAAQVDFFGIKGLAARLDDRFTVLTKGRRTALPRHQTLRSAIDWSYDLLPEIEQVVFRRLAVFRGSFTLVAAAVAVDVTTDISGDITHHRLLDTTRSYALDKLASLVTKSLVTAEADGRVARYRLLDTTRAYALEKLGESGELDPIRRRHATYFRDFLEAATSGRADNNSAEAYLAEIDNIRAALAWAFSPVGDAAIGVALAAAAAPTWIEMALLAECRGWVAAALDLIPPEQLGSRREMALQFALGHSTMLTQGLTEHAHAALERANELGKALDDPDYQFRALVGLVIFRRMSADFSPALAISRQVDAIANEIATPLALATADCLLASSLLWVGEYAEARTRAERGSRQNSPEVRRAHLVRHGYDHWMNSRIMLVQILWVQGFSEQSLQLTRDVLIEAERASHPFTLPYALTTAGCFVALWIGDLQMAEQLISLLKARAGTHGLRSYHAAALGFEGQLHAARGDTAAGRRLLRHSISGLLETRFYTYYTTFLAQLAKVLLTAGEVDEALAAADEAVGRAKQNKHYWHLPEALRIKGEVLLLSSHRESAEAEDHLRQALDWAHRQGALSWELRAASSLARLLREKGRSADAMALLQPVYARFTEGFATSDLQVAKGLLEKLASEFRPTSHQLRGQRHSQIGEEGCGGNALSV